MADKVFELLYCRHVGFRRPFFPFSRDAVLVLVICRVVGPECADTAVGNAAQRRQYHAVGQRLSGIRPEVVGRWVRRVAKSRCKDRNGVQLWNLAGDEMVDVG